jgi:mRNA interferase MazF
LVNRGEIWWFEHPELGRRTALVLTRQTAIPVLNSVLIVPATRTARAIPTEVELDESDGMSQPCVLSFDNLATIPKALFIERVTRVRPQRMAEVCNALRLATGC